MDKGSWHIFSEFLMTLGFLIFVFVGLGSIFFYFDTNISILSVLAGFLLFGIGVEIYLKTR